MLQAGPGRQRLARAVVAAIEKSGPAGGTIAEMSTSAVPALTTVSACRASVLGTIEPKSRRPA